MVFAVSVWFVWRVALPDDAATAALGGRIAQALATQPGGVIYLQGTLGAGKTTLVRGWLRALGVTGRAAPQSGERRGRHGRDNVSATLRLPPPSSLATPAPGG